MNPAAIIDYDTLVAAVAEYLLEQDIQANDIALWISMVEDTLNDTLRTREMLVVPATPAQMTIGDPVLPLPADYLETARFRYVSEQEELEPELVSQQQIVGLRPPNFTGRPVYYAIVGDSIELAPAPETDFDYWLDYYQKIPALTSMNQTNWMISKSSNTYLYGCLAEGYLYFKDDARAQYFEGKFEKERQQVQALDVRSRWRPFSRMRPDTAPERSRRF